MTAYKDLTKEELGCAESSPVDVRTADADQRNREGKGYPDFVSGGA